MAFSRSIEVAIPALCALMLGVGLYAAWMEGRAFLTTPVSDEERFSALAEGRDAVGLSAYSTRYLLQDCEAALTEAYGRLQPEERRRAVAASCRDVAADAIGRSRLDGFAHTVSARASAMLGDIGDAHAGVRRSAQTTPHEMWQAQRRLLVVREWSLDEDPATAELFRRDIAVLANTRDGRRWLARWYVAQPERRDLIASVVDGQEERAKRDFLNAVRSASAAR